MKNEMMSQDMISKIERDNAPWKVVRLIGSGQFGTVYEIAKNEFGQDIHAALKVIRVPASESEITSLYDEGLDDDGVARYFESATKELVKEFDLLDKLKGTTNIVTIEDEKVLPQESGIGYIIYIRMQLLTGLTSYIKQNEIRKQDVIRIGIDICNALIRCRDANIIHRDIKPDNIFVSSHGDFVLGDFGIARKMEHTLSAMTRTGTPDYMAPEVFLGQEYGFACDIYSLGMVLYRLLNDNRQPFIPPAPNMIMHSDRVESQTRRMNGEPFPYPRYDNGELANIVLKAAAYRAEDRFQSPEEFRVALVRLYERGYDGACPILIASRNSGSRSRSQGSKSIPYVAAANGAGNVSGNAYSGNSAGNASGNAYSGNSAGNASGNAYSGNSAGNVSGAGRYVNYDDNTESDLTVMMRDDVDSTSRKRDRGQTPVENREQTSPPQTGKAVKEADISDIPIKISGNGEAKKRMSIGKVFPLLLIGFLLIGGVIFVLTRGGGSSEKDPTGMQAGAVKTEAPMTEAPKTEAPMTEAPKTEAPKESAGAGESQKKSLKISVKNDPETLTLGKLFIIEGTISSDYEIVYAISRVQNEKGEDVMAPAEIAPNEKVIDLRPSELNQNLKFASIDKAGKYTLTIVARDASGAEVTYSKTFEEVPKAKKN